MPKPLRSLLLLGTLDDDGLIRDRRGCSAEWLIHPMGREGSRHLLERGDWVWFGQTNKASISVR